MLPFDVRPREKEGVAAMLSFLLHAAAIGGPRRSRPWRIRGMPCAPGALVTVGRHSVRECRALQSCSRTSTQPDGYRQTWLSGDWVSRDFALQAKIIRWGDFASSQMSAVMARHGLPHGLKTRSDTKSRPLCYIVPDVALAGHVRISGPRPESLYVEPASNEIRMIVAHGREGPQSDVFVVDGGVFP